MQDEVEVRSFKTTISEYNPLSVLHLPGSAAWGFGSHHYIST